jgi:hypothetical protein
MNTSKPRMPNPKQFTRKVLEAIEDYPKFAYYVPQPPRRKGSWRGRGGTRRRLRRKTDRAKAYQRTASALLRQKKLNSALCAALKSVANDASAVAIAISPVMLALRASGDITVPVNPLLVATVAMTVARLGVSALCAEYN